jgi:hypothetical protein
LQGDRQGDNSNYYEFYNLVFVSFNQGTENDPQGIGMWGHSMAGNLVSPYFDQAVQRTVAFFREHLWGMLCDQPVGGCLPQNPGSSGDSDSLKLEFRLSQFKSA